jgi:acyl-CoA synthetase (NDP forming)
MTPPADEGGHPLEAVFAPQSLVVVGASGDPSKRGNQILRAVMESSYGGRVFAVNPRGEPLLGQEVFPSVVDLPEAPDLAVVCTPAATVPRVVQECGERGIRAAVVLAAGFGEAGVDGAALEAAVLEVAERSGVRLLGPNTSGLLNLPHGLNLIGVRGVRPGTLSLVVQSGNMALALMKEATERSWEGVSICAGLGNGRDIGFGDSLDYLGQHAGTRAVLCYLEGAQDLAGFLRSASRCNLRRPVVVLKAGRSSAGAAAARSHTGAVAGPYDRFRAALAQAGITEVLRTDELLHVGETLAWQPATGAGGGVAILSDGGGQGTLAADVLSEMGIPLASLAAATVDRLDALLGPAGATSNPVDLAGAADADPGVFPLALQALMEDEAVGSVLVVGLFGGYAIRFSDTLAGPEYEAAERMASVARAAGKGCVVHSMYALHRTNPLRRLGEFHVPVVASLEVACRCVAELWRRGQWLGAPAWEPGSPSRTAADDIRSIATPSPIVHRVLAEGRDTLTEPEARSLLERSGVRFPVAVVCAGAEEAAEAAAHLGGPVAVKVISPHISHKSDAGGVALDLSTPRDVAAAYHRMVDEAERYLEAKGMPAGVDGVLVTAMHPAPLVELLVGGDVDPQLGPMVTLGHGGTWVERLRDVTHRLLPVDASVVREMLRELRRDRGRGESALRLRQGSRSPGREGLPSVAVAYSHPFRRKKSSMVTATPSITVSRAG